MQDYAEEYRKFRGKRIRFALIATSSLVFLILLATSLGSAELTVADVALSVFRRIWPGKQLASNQTIDVIVWHLRMPRIVMAVLAGGGLGIAGATMQGVLRNPLVSPFTIGVSSGAVLGASCAIVLGFGLTGVGRYVVIGNAFLFAVLTSSLILLLGRLRGITSESFILVGIALMNFFGAFTALLQYIASEEQLAQVVHWTFGSLGRASWTNIAIVFVVIVGCFPVLLRLAWDLNAMAAGGDEVAKSLGVNCGRVRVLCMLLASLVTAAIISFTGLIGFVGLVAPHITRILVGSDHRYLLPFTGLTSAILLLAADTVGRTAFTPVVIPVGIVTSFIGAPFFFFLLMRRKGQHWQ